MQKSTFTDEQIIGFLKQAESGMAVKELCRKHGFSHASFYKWHSRLGGMDFRSTAAPRVRIRADTAR